MKKKDPGGKVVCTNKKAYHDYHIEQVLEAGMVLNGPEIKSLRAGKANLKDGYAQVKNNELFLYNVHISPYPYASMTPPDPLRVRKLLLHRREINKLIGKLKEQGYTLVPLKIYLNPQGRAKLALGLAKGKKLYDKRAALKQKETDRELQRVMRRG
ncbi:SsrA-binding protein SmpB [Desulfurivibrio alkaliphilus]|uniref:SsrA-binding protein n=1 Tax=Desulfurivibrio alkaliphilus (strain DSM 19089 / UNIQEM U267 / AHT2) TaxID=589865 RepID=D6Z6V4_DESAT|nr:SsrA-binding protein SmpB [Desulfurivibrio alkaliphilus]ADH86941.1 SsrA-binding protein [Desulfurivibrio alkaliphilus AHT 2]